MSNFFKEGVVDSVTQIRFFSSIAFAPNPGPIALASIASVVENLKYSGFFNLNNIGIIPQHLFFLVFLGKMSFQPKTNQQKKVRNSFQ